MLSTYRHSLISNFNFYLLANPIGPRGDLARDLGLQSYHFRQLVDWFTLRYFYAVNIVSYAYDARGAILIGRNISVSVLA